MQKMELFLILCLFVPLLTVAASGQKTEKKLIEFGWDEPDTAFMRRHLAEMEQTPFDGCVFHLNYPKPDGSTSNFTWECWSKRLFTESELKSALDDLKATPFRRFKHNFLRFNVTPGDVDWFDDFSPILHNAQLAARIAREGKCAGILFDIEQYNSPLFDYRKQRDASSKSWEEYAAQARKRGREVMQAFQQGFPNVKVFLTFGYCLPWAQSQGGKKPLADCSYGLLAPFLDGMVEAIKGKVQLIDGHELAYGYREITKFAAAYQTMKQELLPIVADPKKYHRVFSFSFGIWMDGDWRRVGWHTDDFSKNYHTPEQFEQIVREALKVADEYVWIYSETPRWWSDEGKPVKLPEAYLSALRRARGEPVSSTGRFEGRYFAGKGDVEYLQLLEIARRMFAPDPEFQNMAMLYTPAWNGLVEGPTWDAWWIQNSYGTTYSALPFYQEPFITFLQNSQDLWFDQMGDGKRVGANPPFNWVAPDGCLCDAARPGWVVYKQGDGRIDIHDWGMEFTAAGLLMQAELLLISRDMEAIHRYLPKLERCANFIETRRDPEKNLFLAGPAGNLLAPSYAGWKRPDGTYGMAYLTGLSITYIAALDRLIELEKLAGNAQKARLYAGRRELARKGLSQLVTEEGYFIRSLDPDGTKHGVYGAEKHGYFEASPNHDAIALRVVDDAQAGKIYSKIASIPGLRPYDFIIPNYPSYDDMYEKPEGLWAFGTWVNGGHWSTCEARMVLSYYRLGKYEDARKSMKQLLTFARRFRMDNPLVKFGSDVYQPHEPINITYDAFGPAAALIRGLFEYLYRADGLTLMPHIPPGVTELEQRFPIRFGKKRLYLATVGSGTITGVWVNGKEWKEFDQKSVFLPYDQTPDTARIVIALGGAKPSPSFLRKRVGQVALLPPVFGAVRDRALQNPERLHNFYNRLVKAGLGESYEAAHARLVLECLATLQERQKLLSEGKLKPLSEPSQSAADKSYVDTVNRLSEGLEKMLQSYADSQDAHRQRVYQIWKAISP